MPVPVPSTNTTLFVNGGSPALAMVIQNFANANASNPALATTLVGIINDDPLLFQNLNSAAIAGNLTSIQFTNSSDVAGDFSGTTIFIPKSLLLGASNDNSGTELDTINLVFTIGHES